LNSTFEPPPPGVYSISADCASTGGPLGSGFVGIAKSHSTFDPVTTPSATFWKTAS